MTTPSQTPTRFTAGISTDQPWQPLANYGMVANPFFYQLMQDDFMGTVTGNENWQSVTSGTGAAVAEVAGDGGQWRLTTSSAGAGTAGIVGNLGNFVLPPATYGGIAGLTGTTFPSKKMFFLSRINITTPASVTGFHGLMPSTTTTGTPTDGIVFNFTNLTTVALNAYSASTLQWSLPIPAAALTNWYAAAQWLDIGFYMDRLQNVYAFLGFPLIGFVPASAWSGTNNVNAVPPPLGAVAAYQTSVSGAWTPSTANLTLGAIFTGTTQTVYLDCMLAAKER